MDKSKDNEFCFMTFWTVSNRKIKFVASCVLPKAQWLRGLKRLLTGHNFECGSEDPSLNPNKYFFIFKYVGGDNRTEQCYTEIFVSELSQ